MRICLIATGEIYGGAERQIITLIRAMNSHSFYVVLFYNGRLATELRDLGIRVVILRRRSKFDRKTSKILAKLLASDRFDVVHLHGYLAAIYAYSARRSLPHIIVKTEHGLPELPHNNLYSNIKMRLIRRLERFAVHRLNCRVVFVTQELAELLSSDFPTCDWRVIHNGLGDRQATTQAPAEFRDFAVNFVCVGRLENVKGFDIAIESFSGLIEYRSSSALHIFGDGPESAYLGGLIAKFRAEDRIFLHGIRNNIECYFDHADAIIIPSRHEGLPYVLLEAMQSGCFVIAAEIGGLKEVLTDELTCYFFTAGDIESLRVTIAKAIESPDAVEQICRNAREFQQSQFSAQSMADQYINLFKRANVASDL